MKKNNYKFGKLFALLITAVLLSITTIHGQNLSLAPVLASNMVLQQNTQAAIWGWTAPNSNVQITASWGQTANAVADATGKWSTKIQTPAAVAGTTQTQHTLTFVGASNTITLTNILIGDVYLCSGQSNMVYIMGPSSANPGVINWETEVASANYPNIRLNKSGLKNSAVPSYTTSSTWMECNPTNVKNFSAVAYYFARHLHNNPNINIPIGVIVAAVGGTTIQTWMSREALSADPELKTKVQDVATDANARYNGMIASYIPFSIAGFLWYQGEANSTVASYSELYGKLLTALINDWRAKWGQGNLPFYFVQLPVNTGFTPEFREQFSNTLSVPNTGMAVTLDLADADMDIHPSNKLDVGIRLAKIAEANIYKQNVVFAGSIGTGLISANDQPLTKFKIASSDNVYVDATAVIDGNDVLVSASSVSNPTNVAFAYSSTAIPNLYNKEGLLACPFRTDRWNYSITLGANSPNAITKIIAEKFEIYPVPANEKLNIKLLDDTKISSYMITDITGKIQSKSNNLDFKGDLSIDVSLLKNGYYTLQLNLGNNLQTAPFIKN